MMCVGNDVWRDLAITPSKISKTKQKINKMQLQQISSFFLLFFLLFIQCEIKLNIKKTFSLQKSFKSLKNLLKKKFQESFEEKKKQKKSSSFRSSKNKLLTNSTSLLKEFPFLDEICFMSSQNNCNLNQFKFGQVIQIFPSANSGCGCLESTSPYSFQVFIGDPEKILIVFQGGGICWSQTAFDKGRCRTKALPLEPDGFLKNSSQNIYSSYTKVILNYCTGDLFLGNKTTDFVDSTGNTTQYNGVSNTLYVLSWLKQQQQFSSSIKVNTTTTATNTTTNTTEINPFLPPLFLQLVISGSSAGSIASQLWSDYIIRQFQSISYLVVFDSMFTFMASDTQYNLYQKWNLCSSIQIFPISSLCSSLSPYSTSSTSTMMSEMNHVNLMKVVLDRNYAIPYILIQSKYDETMITIFNWLLQDFPSTNIQTNMISATDYYTILSSDIHQFYDSSNFILYLVDASHHLYLYANAFYTTTEDGYLAASQTPLIGTPLYEWLQSILIPSNTTIDLNNYYNYTTNHHNNDDNNDDYVYQNSTMNNNTMNNNNNSIPISYFFGILNISSKCSTGYENYQYIYCDSKLFPKSFEFTIPMILSNSPPTRSPTTMPTIETNSPSHLPTSRPSLKPTKYLPTRMPTKNPTSTPTRIIRNMPSLYPTNPTRIPSKTSTKNPTIGSTRTPTKSPTNIPSTITTSIPTPLPTNFLVHFPTKLPTISPTHSPTLIQKSLPTKLPTRSSSHF